MFDFRGSTLSFVGPIPLELALEYLEAYRLSRELTSLPDDYREILAESRSLNS
jgi:hypothetical protein